MKTQPCREREEENIIKKQKTEEFCMVCVLVVLYIIYLILPIYCCITNFPKIEQLQTTNIYYFMIPLCQESGHGLAWCLCPKSLLKLWPNCWPGLLSSQGYTGPGDCAFQLTRRPQSLPMWLTSQYLTVLYSKVGSFPQDKQSERGHSS